jgi:hypothetical protein
MSASSVELVTAYARSPEPRIRENVGAALAALSDGAADPDVNKTIARAMFELVVHEEDLRVQDRLAFEVSKLDKKSRDSLLREVAACSADVERSTRLRLGPWLGALRLRGVNVPPPPVALALRLWNAGRPRGLSWRHLLTGMAGSVPAMVVLALHLLGVLGVGAFAGIVTLVLVWLLAAAIVGLLGVRRQQAYILQWEPRLTVVRDALEAAVMCMAITEAMILLEGPARLSLTHADLFLPSLVPTAVVGAAIAAVHLACAIAMPGWRTREVSRFFQYAAGHAAGLVVLGLYLYSVRRLVPMATPAHYLAESTWIVAVPVMGGLAWTVALRNDVGLGYFARLLAGAASRRQRTATILMSLPVLVVVAAVAYVSGSALGSLSSSADIELGSARLEGVVQRPSLVPLRGESTHVRFELAGPQRLVLAVPAEIIGRRQGGKYDDFRIDLHPAKLETDGRCSAAAGMIIDRADDPPILSAVLPAGCYVVSVINLSRSNSRSEMSPDVIVEERVRRHGRDAAPRDDTRADQAQLEVTFNADGATQISNKDEVRGTAGFVIGKNPVTLALEVRHPSAVRVRMLSDSDWLSPGSPRRDPTAERSLELRAGSNQQSSPIDTGAGLLLSRVLQPGKYTLSARSSGDSASSGYIDFLPRLGPDDQVITDKNITAVISGLPATLEVRVLERSRMEADFDDRVFGMIVEVLEGDTIRKTFEYGAVDLVLEPGTYRIRASGDLRGSAPKLDLRLTREPFGSPQAK